MKGDISSTVAFENFDAALGKQLGQGDYVCRFRVAAEGYDRRVLKQQERVTNAAFFAEGNELFLKAETGGVVNRAELEDRDQIFWPGLRLLKNFATGDAEELKDRNFHITRVGARFWDRITIAGNAFKMKLDSFLHFALDFLAGLACCYATVQIRRIR